MVTYVINRPTENGYEDCDILAQYFNDNSLRSVVVSKEDFANLAPWNMCRLLNEAYEQGRKEAMFDIRRLIGINP
jgi:hypothetical protein